MGFQKDRQYYVGYGFGLDDGSLPWVKLPDQRLPFDQFFDIKDILIFCPTYSKAQYEAQMFLAINLTIGGRSLNIIGTESSIKGQGAGLFLYDSYSPYPVEFEIIKVNEIKASYLNLSGQDHNVDFIIRGNLYNLVEDK